MKEWYDGETAVVPGTLRGYRFWRYDRIKMELLPVHINLGPWQLGLNFASCASDRSLLRSPRVADAGKVELHHHDYDSFPAPMTGCTCGIYATYDDSYRVHRPRFWVDYGDDVPSLVVHGSIKASGRVLLGEKGFRASKAEVEALWGWRAKPAAWAYGVPWFFTYREFVRHYPPHDVSSLLEE